MRLKLQNQGVFIFLQMFAGVQEQLCCTTEQHWLSALVRTVLQNMCECSILTRLICHTLRYLPNTDTPMCDPWAAVQFNKHQCKFSEKEKFKPFLLSAAQVPEEACRHCLPNCEEVKILDIFLFLHHINPQVEFLATVSSAPFRR